MPPTYYVGQRLSFSSSLCTIRYIGSVKNTKNEWLGVEWDDPLRGKHDGELGGVRYFRCVSKSKKAASFIRPNRPADLEQSFVEAVHQKYATEITTKPNDIALDQQHVISGKIVEEVGFDKIRRQLAQLQELRIVIVDGLRIKSAETPSLRIKDVCPKIVELDLSRNLFDSFDEIVHICGELDRQRGLRLNGNRFNIKEEGSDSKQLKLKGITELELDDVLLPWQAICSVVESFPSLKSFTASSNHLDLLSTPILTPNLTSLTLEYNNFTSLSDLSPLSKLGTLQNLLLKGNQISVISRGSSEQPPVFSTALKYVDLSYNSVLAWAVVDDLSDCFPGLEALRFSHNPIYESFTVELGSAKAAEEGYMFTLARMGKLKTLNFSNITTADRTNAEMYYLSRIAKAMADVPESEEGKIISQHKRYPELCEIYGTPDVVRKSTATINPEFLEARLIKFAFHKPPTKEGEQEELRIVEIPRSFDVYRVKGIVGRAYGLTPLGLRLTWETGEWDPVAGYEDEENSEEDDDESVAAASARKDKGKWLKREVEIEDGTRQIGFCVDGMEAKVRVEIR